MTEDINIQEILNNPTAKIYFVGIGGIAMSAVASIAAKLGYEVSGSDSKELYSPAKEVLTDSGVKFNLGYNAKNISSGIDLFILSAGEDLNNPEVKEIVEKNLPRTSFAELLYVLSKDKLRVVVAGTHGKSTTTGFLGHVFKNLDDSSFMAGGVLQNYKTNFHLGEGHYFVFEGDEYKSQFDDPTPKFQYYKPDVLVLTNLEYDHPDLFPDFESLVEEFRLLIANMPEDGLIVYNADNEMLTKLVHESNVANVSFGIENEADFKAEQIQYGGEFTVLEISNKFSKNVSAHLLGATEEYKIQLPGQINAYNALAVIATLRALGFAQEQIALELISYLGVKRRFEVVGRKNGIIIVDDYAHHPTAVRETLKAARLRYFSAKDEGFLPKSDIKDKGLGIKDSRRLWAVFEPHTFSRTKATLEELTTSFDAADQVLISEIYPAREKASSATITSEEVIAAIKDKGLGMKDKIRLVKSKTEALDILKTELKPGDVVIIMAVGSFNRLAYELKEVI